MGIFDSFLGDVQREIRRATDSVDAVKSSARKVVDAIDAAEEKVNNLPTEEEVKKKLKQKLSVAKEADKDKEPTS